MAQHPNLPQEVSGIEQTLGQAVHFHQRGRLDKAERLYQQILKRKPNHFDALHLLGVIRGQQGRNDEAWRLIGRAVLARPNSAEAHSNLGNVLQALGRHEEAVASYDKALAINPRNADALNNRGNALQKLGRYPEAVACYDHALAIRGNFPDGFYNRGNALSKLLRYREAVQDYDRAIALRPGYAEAHHNRGKALHELRRFEAALSSYQQAIAIDPGHVDALNNRGVTLVELGRYQEALTSYDQALSIEPKNVDALHNRACVLQELKRYDEALESFGAVLAMRPDHKFSFGAAAQCALAVCDWARAHEIRRQLPDRIRNANGIVPPLTAISYEEDPALQLECARNYIASKTSSLPMPVRSATREHGRPRIAYLSADYHRHAMAYLTAELFELHDRTRFEVFGISFGPDDRSEIRARIMKGFDRFFDARSLDDAGVAELLAKLEIDIAVDLNGNTQGARPDVLARRPAPIQVNYLGFPGTMGATFIDYIVADPIVLPLEEQSFYPEHIVHLPDCYQVNDAKRRIAEQTPTRAQAGLPEHGFVFCCFNKNFKIAAPVFDRWMRLLRALDGSALWLFRDNARAERNLRKEAELRGIDPARLIFAEGVPLEQHLARHRLADLFLDTLPYNAHTTASDALWAGLPVLTCKGRAFAGRVGASLLHAAGLPELVTSSLAEYEARAIELATTPALLGSIRAKLERNRSTCALFDSRRFCRHIEAAYLMMWHKHGRGEPPGSFRVEPIDPEAAGS